MDLDASECLVAALAKRGDLVQLHYAELEKLIAWCMEEVFRLAKSGEDEARKMQMVNLEHQARLLIDQFRASSSS